MMTQGKYNSLLLVDKNDTIIGIKDKMQAHQEGLLHRAFSIFIFNRKGEMLIQQRAASKYHSPLLWTNACCSHQQRDNDDTFLHQRLQFEMGFDTTLTYQFKHYYKAPFENSLIEHEIDHVFTGVHDSQIRPNPDEVEKFTYIPVQKLLTEIRDQPHNFTVWFKELVPHLLTRLAM